MSVCAVSLFSHYIIISQTILSRLHIKLVQQLIRLIFLNTLQIEQPTRILDGFLRIPILLVVPAQVDQALRRLFIVYLLLFFAAEIFLEGVGCF